jgi:predicted site-specific integrase-resolvase
MANTNPYITLSKAMEEFGLSRQTLYRLRKDGKLPEYELGGRKYLDINDLLALIKKSESRTNHDESPG